MLWKLIASFNLIIILFVQDAYVEESENAETNTESPSTDDVGTEQDGAGETPIENATEQTGDANGEEDTGQTGGEGVTGETGTNVEEEQVTTEENPQNSTDLSVEENETVNDDNLTVDFTTATEAEVGETAETDLLESEEDENETGVTDGEESEELIGETTVKSEVSVHDDEEEEEEEEEIKDDQQEQTQPTQDITTTTEHHDLDEDLEEEEEDIEVDPEFVETESSEDDTEDIEEDWDGTQVNATGSYKRPLGEYAIRVASILRNNLINLFGYLMYQPKLNTGHEVFFYLHHLKSALEANKVDIFELIPILTSLHRKSLDHKLLLVIDRMKQIMSDRYCHYKCSADMLSKRQFTINMELIMGHITFDPILNGILNTPDDLPRLKALVKNLKRTQKPERSSRTRNVFNPQLIRIMGEIGVVTPLTDELISYILQFLPWPVGRFDINLAIDMMSHALQDDRVSLVNCGVDIDEIWNDAPIAAMKKLMTAIIESKCDRVEKVASRILREGLDKSLTFPNYRNTFPGVYAEINRLWELLDVINHQNFPPEIINAREIFAMYLDKVVYYLNYPRFTAYRYVRSEDMLLSFIDFVLIETPYLNPTLSLALYSMRAYLNFFSGPKVVTYDLFVSVIQGLMAPDLNEDVIDYMLEVKTFVLDEAPNIKRVLKLMPDKRCTALIPCYFQILTMLSGDPYFKDKMNSLKMDRCLMRRHLGYANMPTERGTSSMINKTAIVDLLDIVNHQSYTREVVLSAQQIKKHLLRQAKSVSVESVPNIYCTKSETLLHGLEWLAKDQTQYPPNVKKSFSSVIAATKFKLIPIDKVNVRVMQRILDAWKTPFTEEELLSEMKRIEAIIRSNQKSIDALLNNMNPSDCMGLAECYGGIVQHLNNMGSTFSFHHREENSPAVSYYELERSSSARSGGMTVKHILEIVESIQADSEDNSALEAAKSYMRDCANDIDMAIREINCADVLVPVCFKMILDKMRFSPELRHIEVKIVQYLLLPTTCDDKNCWWIPYLEVGSVPINPIFEYMQYLLAAYSADKVESLHLDMDIYLILEYMSREDMAELLDRFQLRAGTLALDRVLEFLSLLQTSKLIEKNAMHSIKNVYEFVANNVMPESLNIANLYYMKTVFQEWTNDTKVRYELHEIEENIRDQQAEVSAILKNLYVDCYTLERCINMINSQLNTVAFDQPAAKPILKLFKPDSCPNKKVCPWIVEAITGSEFIKVHILPEINKIMEDPREPLIRKVVWKIIKEKLEHNTHVLKDTIKPKDIPGKGQAKLKMFIEKVLVNVTDETVKRYLVAARKNLGDPSFGFGLDVLIMKELLDYMYEDTRDGDILSDIKEVKSMIGKGRPQLDSIFLLIRLTCPTLQECVQDVADGLIGKAKKVAVKLLLELLYAKKCAENDCPWRATGDSKLAAIYKNKMIEFLEQLKEDAPFIVTLDAEDVLEYMERDDVLEVIFNIICGYDLESESDIIYKIFEGIASEDNTPQQIGTSIKAILNYVKRNELSTYLQVSNVKRMAEKFLEQSTSDAANEILDSTIVFLKGQAAKVANLLSNTPIDCKTQDSCVKSLYQRLQNVKDDKIAATIITMLKPSPCKIKTCPWIKPIAGLGVNAMTKKIMAELAAMQKHKNITLHIKLDIQAFKKVVKQCKECIIKVIESRQTGVKIKYTAIFLKTIDPETLKKYDLEYVKKDIDVYLLSGALPKYMDVPVFLIFAELLKKIAKMDKIKREIEKYKVKIFYAQEEARTILLSCQVDCRKIRGCVKSIHVCLREESVKDMPAAILIENILNPKQCNKKICPWVSKDSQEDLMKRFDEIKELIRNVIANETVPIIIRVLAKHLLDKVEFVMVEPLLSKIPKNHPDKLDMFLSLMTKEQKRKVNDKLVRPALKVRNYLKTEKLPEHLIWDDLHGIVFWIIDLSKEHPEVTDYLNAAMNILVKSHAEVEKILKKCPVQCVELKSCLGTLADCFKKSKSSAAYISLKIIFPDPCTAEICPWMPDRPADLDENFPIKNPPTIRMPMPILIYKRKKKEKYVILDLSNKQTISLLEAYSYIADCSIRRIIVVQGKGGTILKLDFVSIKGIEKAGSKLPLELDFDATPTATICIQFKNGILRPFKYDLGQQNVRAALVQLAKEQADGAKSSSKRIITLKDKSLGNHKLYLNVLDPKITRRLLEPSIDDVIPPDYKAVFFWAAEKGKPWRSAIIEDKSPLESYLRNMPGTDYAGAGVPVVVTFEGIITMDFDVHDEDVVDGIEAAASGFSAVLDANVHTKYMLYLPFPLRKNMVPFPVELDDKKKIQLLVDAGKKYPVEGSNETTFTIDTGEKQISIRYDLFSEVGAYLVFGQTGDDEDESEDDGTATPNDVPNIKWVVINAKGGKVQVVLNLENPKVRETLLDKFISPPQQGRVVVFNVVDDRGVFHAVSINTDDETVIKILVSLSHSTIKYYNPFSTTTSDGKTKIIVVIIKSGKKNIAVVLEDTKETKQNMKQLEGQGEGDKVRLPFESGAVKLTQEVLIEHVKKEQLQSNLPLISYVGNIEIKTLVLPITINGTLYYVTVDSSNHKAIEVLLQQNKPDADGSSLTIIIIDTSGKQVVVTIPGEQEDSIIIQLKETGIKLQAIIRTEAMMVIVTVDDQMLVKSFILNLDNEIVFNTLQKEMAKVDPESTTKGVYFFVNTKEEVIPIILDNGEYDVKIFEGLEQFTPVDLPPVYIPNADGVSPLVGFMLEKSGQEKMSIFLKPSDKVVWRGLVQINKASKKKGISISVTDAKGKLHTLKVDVKNKSVVKKLVNMAQRLDPSHIPTMPIPPDGTSLITISVMENDLKVKKTINTRDELQVKELRAKQAILPETEPVMFVMNPEGKGEEIRVDMRGYKDASTSDCKINVRQVQINIAVVKPENHTAIILNLGDRKVSEAILSIVEERNTSSEASYLVFVDYEGQVQKVQIDMKDPEVINLLLNLMKETTPVDVAPFELITEDNKDHVAFVVVDENGHKQPIVLDITKNAVKDALIELWDGSSTDGVSIPLKDSNGQPIVIHIDTTRKDVVDKLIGLTEHTETIEIPIVVGGFGDSSIIKIPVVEDGKTFVINCNVSDPVIAGKLRQRHSQRLAGRRTPVAIMFNDAKGKPVIINPDLNDAGVIRSLKKICQMTTGVLDGDSTVILNIVDSSGHKQTNVLDLSDQQVVDKIVQVSEVVAEEDEGEKKRHVIYFPVVDLTGSPQEIPIDIDDAETQETLAEVTQETIGENTYEPLIIKDDQSSHMTIFSVIGAIVIDQNNEVLINEILSTVSEPDNPSATRFVFVVNDEPKTAYLEIYDPDKMKLLKEIVDKYFEAKVFPPKRRPKKEQLQLPCVNNENQKTLIILDVRRPDVLNAFKQIDAFCRETGTYNLEVSIRVNGKPFGPFWMDTTNAQLCHRLFLVSIQHKFAPAHGSLLIINIPNTDKPVIFLDLTRPQVIKGLEKISKKVRKDDATHFVLALTKGIEARIFKIDTRLQDIVSMLRHMAEYTPVPMMPAVIANPYGKIPLVIFTIDTPLHGVCHMVLNPNVQEVKNELDGLTSYRGESAILTSIAFESEYGSSEYYLDLQHETVTNGLLELTKKYHGIHDAILNIPPKNPHVKNKIMIGIENSHGSKDTFVVDMTDVKQYESLQVKAGKIPLTTAILMLYFKPRDVVPVRVDIKRMLTDTPTNQVTKILNPEYVLILMSDSKNDKSRKWFVLNLENEQNMVDIDKLQIATPITKSFSTVTVREKDFNNRPKDIKIRLSDKMIEHGLEEMLDRTPRPMHPILIASPFGPKPLLVLTVEDEKRNKTVPILIDMNNPSAVDQLQMISSPEVRNTPRFVIPGRSNTKIKISLDLFSLDVQRVLIQASVLTPPIEAPILGKMNDILLIPLPRDKEVLSVKVDITNQHNVKKLIELSAPAGQQPEKFVKFYVPDPRGVLVLVVLDISRKDIIDQVIHIGGATGDSTSVSPGGINSINLIVVSMHLPDGMIQITIDPNNAKVLEILQSINEEIPDPDTVSTIKIPLPDGKQLVVNINTHDPNMRDLLNSITDLADVTLTPVIVVPPGGRNPIFSMIVKIGDKSVLIVIDPNNKDTIDKIKQTQTDNDKGTVKIDFVAPDGVPDSVYIDLDDPKVVSVIQKEMKKIIVYPVPSKTDQILQIHDDSGKWQINLNDPIVVKVLNDLSSSAADKQKVWIIEFISPQECRLILYINVTPKLKDQIEGILPAVPPIWNIKIISTVSEIKVVLPAVIIFPPHGMYPLIMTDITSIGPVVWDINNETVFDIMIRITDNECTSKKCLLMEVPDGTGDGVTIKIDIRQPKALYEVRKIPRHPYVTYEVEPGNILPTVYFIWERKIYRLDLNNPKVILLLQKIFKPSPDAYKIIITLPLKVITVYVLLSSIHQDLNSLLITNVTLPTDFDLTTCSSIWTTRPPITVPPDESLTVDLTTDLWITTSEITPDTALTEDWTFDTDVITSTTQTPDIDITLPSTTTGDIDYDDDDIVTPDWEITDDMDWNITDLPDGCVECTTKPRKTDGPDWNITDDGSGNWTDVTADEGDWDISSPSTTDEGDWDISSPSTTDESDWDISSPSTTDEGDWDISSPSTTDEGDWDISSPSTTDEGDWDISSPSTTDDGDWDISSPSTTDDGDWDISSPSSTDDGDWDISSPSTTDEGDWDISSPSSTDDGDWDMTSPNTTDDGDWDVVPTTEKNTPPDLGILTTPNETTSDILDNVESTPVIGEETSTVTAGIGSDAETPATVSIDTDETPCPDCDSTPPRISVETSDGPGSEFNFTATTGPDQNISVPTGADGDTLPTVSMETEETPCPDCESTPPTISVETSDGPGSEFNFTATTGPDQNISIPTGADGDTLPTVSMETEETPCPDCETTTPHSTSEILDAEWELTSTPEPDGDTLPTVSMETEETPCPDCEPTPPHTTNDILDADWNLTSSPDLDFDMTVPTGVDWDTLPTISIDTEETPCPDCESTLPTISVATSDGPGSEFNLTATTGPDYNISVPTGADGNTLPTISIETEEHTSPTEPDWSVVTDGSTPEAGIDTLSTIDGDIVIIDTDQYPEGSTPEGGVETLTPVPTTSPYTTEFTSSPTPQGNWSLNVTTDSGDGHNMYWVAINLTNYVTFEVYMYVFDVSLEKVLRQLQLYVESLTAEQHSITVMIPTPKGQFTLHINPYDQKTFTLFWSLTVISTGKPPVFIGVIRQHLWWNFTITDNYGTVIKVELDLNNPSVVEKLQILSSWFQNKPGGQGVIIKGELMDGREFQIIIDLSCSVTIQNLLQLMVESHGGPSKPLIPLPPIDPNPPPQIIEINIRLPGAGKEIKVTLNIADEKVWKKFLELGEKFKPGASNVIVTIVKDNKKYEVKLNVADKDTLKQLIEISENPMTPEQIAEIFQSIYLPSFLTIEISDGKESVSVTVDVVNEKVMKILKSIEPKDQTYSTIINYRDSNNVTYKVALNLNNRQVINILHAVGVPTIYPRRVPEVRLLTFIFVVQNGEYTAILLDLANRATIIFFIEVVRKYQSQFTSTSCVEVRDDNAQYVSIEVDFYHAGFVRELLERSFVATKHRISSEDVPFVVFCIPRNDKKKYANLKMTLNYATVEKLRELLNDEKGITVDVVDERSQFRIDPANPTTFNRIIKIKGVAFIQPSRPKPLTIVYTVFDNMVQPIYLNMKDPQTINKLINMHNNYASSGGRYPLTVMRFKTTDKSTEYLLLYVKNQVALNYLAKLSIQVGDHHFAKQKIEKIASISIPQRDDKDFLIHLNLADLYTLGELRRMTVEQLPNSRVQTVKFTDAYGNPLVISLDFTDQTVLRKLMKLSVK